MIPSFRQEKDGDGRMYIPDTPAEQATWWYCLEFEYTGNGSGSKNARDCVKFDLFNRFQAEEPQLETLETS